MAPQNRRARGGNVDLVSADAPVLPPGIVVPPNVPVTVSISATQDAFAMMAGATSNLASILPSSRSKWITIKRASRIADWVPTPRATGIIQPESTSRLALTRKS